MKNIYLFTILLLFLISCNESELMQYKDVPRVYLGGYERQASRTFYYDSEEVIRDTVYIYVETMGGPKEYNRSISFKQMTIYDIEYVIENGQKIDSTITENPHNAVAGKHFLAFDNDEAKKMMIIPANEVNAKIPVVLFRDLSLKNDEYYLKLQLVENEEFKIGGEQKDVEFTITFADKLIKPNFWGNNPYAGGYWLFKEYSTRKHKFMIDVTGERIDDDWYNTKVYGINGASNYYQAKFRTALDKFNNDPENIRSGAAPMREIEGDLTSKEIKF